MKKLFLIIIPALCIIASCSKDSGFGPGSDLSPMLNKGYPAHCPVIVYSPSGDGDDTEELLALITGAKPGSVIKLAEGEYHLGYMQIFGFDGSIIGAGRGKTTILMSDLIEANYQSDVLNLLPAWLRIVGGNVLISDLTFETEDATLRSDEDPIYLKALASLVAVNNYDADYMPEDPSAMNFTIKNVDFFCGSLDPEDGFMGQPHNVVMPLWIGMLYWYPPAEGITLTKGNYNVINCYFENAIQGPEFASFGSDASGTVDRVITKDCFCGAYFTGNYGSRIKIINSKFNQFRFYGLTIEDNDWGMMGPIEPSRSTEYIISGNTFTGASSTPALIFRDWWGVTNPDKYKPTSAMIKNNLFNLSEGCTGISYENNIGGQVRNNIFSGTGSVGVTVDGIMIYDVYTGAELGYGEAKNVLILGNNFSRLNATDADIILGERSKNCTVIGSVSDDVINNGTDNKVIGLKPVRKGHHFGPSVRDNFRMWHGMRHR